MLLPTAPVPTPPDSSQLHVLQKGKEVSPSQANTMLWSQALKDTISLKNKIKLKLITG